MAGEKQLFAPLPLRAMAAELSGLQMRALACVAAHDRMSLAIGKGQGCRASNERMRGMIGCNFARLCTTLSELVELGFLQREKHGRHTIYRVVYTDDDRLLFSDISGRKPVADRLPSGGVTCCQHNSENGQVQLETVSQYITLSVGIDSVETGEDNSSEEARLSPRNARQDVGTSEKVRSVASEVALFERRFRQNWTQFDGSLSKWVEWLSQQHEELFDEDPTTARRAERLADEVENFIGLIAFENQRAPESI